MPLLCLAFLLSSGSAEPNLLPQWARGEWSRQDKAYSQILDEVRPFCGKDGFIDEELVGQKCKYHIRTFLADSNSNLNLMRALAWHELSMSDGQLSRDKELSALRQRFIDIITRWPRPIDSYSFVRTMAICILRSRAHDSFLGNRLIEKLYAANPGDTELELHYILWASMNPSVAPNRLTLVKLLEKQEKLAFRKGARLLFLSMAYRYVAVMETPLSKPLTEKSIKLMFDHINALPKGHALNTPEYRKKAEKDAQGLRAYMKNWKD